VAEKNIFKRVFEAITAKPSDISLLEKEVSSSQNRLAGGNYEWPAYNPDTLVGKKGLEIYKKMKEDDQVKACLSIKKFARLSTKWDIEPGDPDSPQSIEMADFIRYTLRNLKGTFERNLLNILTAVEYGFSVTEKVYTQYTSGKYKGKIGLKKLASREPFYYDFLLDKHDNIIGITSAILGDDNLGSADNPFPLDKFVVYSYNSEHDSPYGTSDLRSAYRGYWSKDMNIHWWNIFNERFGMPTVVFSYPAAGKDGKGLNEKVMKMLDGIIKNIQAKSGFRIPDTIKAELLEATRRGEDTYTAAINKYDLMISRAILIPTLLAYNEQQTGSYALGKEHFDVFIFVLEMLGRDIEETIVGEQIIKPLIALNYGEDVDEDLMPKFKFESLTDDDSEARARVIQMLANAGIVDKREDWVRDYVGIPERDTTRFPYAVPDGQPLAEGLPGALRPGQYPEDDDEEGSIFQLSREPNKYEKKVNFEQLSNDYNIIGKSVKLSLEEVVGWWKEDLMKKAKKALDEKDYAAVNDIKIRYQGEFKNVLRDNMIKVFLDSKLHSLQEIEGEGVPVEIKTKFSAMFAKSQIEPWEPLPPREAMDFFNKKVLVKVVMANGEKKMITLAKLKDLDYYDKKAFAIAGIEQDYILKEAKTALFNGIKQDSAAQTMTQLEKIFDKYIESGVLQDGKLLTASRLENIVRTNTTEALNEGRMAMFNDPDVTEFVPYVMISAIIDDRTTEICRQLDGKIFRKSEMRPAPYHYQCRTIVVPITTYEVEQGGVEISRWEEEVAAGGGIMEGFCHHGEHFEILPYINPLIDITNATRCPRSWCGKDKLEKVKEEPGVMTYKCSDCQLIFRTTNTGGLFFFEPGNETWERQNRKFI